MNKIERLLAKVSLPEGCWLWTGATAVGGYGRLRSGSRAASRTELAHRVMWEAIHGPIIGGLDVLHHCDTPACVRPDHLYLGRDAENAHDRAVRGRSRAILTGDQVRIMRAAHADGVSTTVLAQQFGVSVPTAHEAIRGRTWKHVK